VSPQIRIFSQIQKLSHSGLLILCIWFGTLDRRSSTQSSALQRILASSSLQCSHAVSALFCLHKAVDGSEAAELRTPVDLSARVVTPHFHAYSEQCGRLIAGQRLTQAMSLIPLTPAIHIISYASQQVTRHALIPTHLARQDIRSNAVSCRIIYCPSGVSCASR